MSDTIWLMDTDFCSECGCILNYFECDLCDDCREDLEWDEEMVANEFDEDWL